MVEYEVEKSTLSVLPMAWVHEKLVYWPPSKYEKSFFHNCQPYETSWRTYNLIAILLNNVSKENAKAYLLNYRTDGDSEDPGNYRTSNYHNSIYFLCFISVGANNIIDVHL